MRVISGMAKGRPLKAVPGSSTRPTTDKVKEAIFSMIGPYFQGGTALDLFAGTGGLGIEALSRGIERVVFTDIERKSIEVIHANLEATGFTGQSEVYRNEATKALKILAKRHFSFDLIFLDPPYKLKSMAELLLDMEQLQLFNANATVIVEHDAAFAYSDRIGNLQLKKKAVYGDTAISIYEQLQDKLDEIQTNIEAERLV